MSDELVRRARALEAHIRGMDSGSGDAQLIGGLAARIEALEAERDEWKAEVASIDAAKHKAERALAASEAKVARLVEALGEI